MVFHTRSTRRRERRHCGRGRPIVLAPCFIGKRPAAIPLGPSRLAREAIVATAVPADKLEIVLSSSSQSFLSGCCIR